ncbi:MAG: NifB/NifX family molybdenum-iron cluster-binding protein [Sulfurospirillaceae bacterium]|jgi:nitrogen fixation protein NifX|nr:NifB/NifX family molybdenum-iron cluster-binding protein [Sulfurospirillaceae bacterium]MDD2826121.1 NifB/NifX family molybdenum-iron cluster-binding protein [Sulfurospirillaceae bacterium]
MKIAFASTDNLLVNEHFGWCKCFYMYELENDSFTFLQSIDASAELSDESEKLSYKINCVKDAHILYVAQIGPKASMLVKNAGIFAMRATKEDESIKEVLESLLKLTKNNPPLWMQRLLHVPRTTNDSE